MKFYIKQRDWQIMLGALVATLVINGLLWLALREPGLSLAIPVNLLVFGLGLLYLWRRDEAGQIYDQDVASNYRQIEALFNLYHTLNFQSPLPRFRYWAASPDCCLELVRIIQSRKCERIVECGSGISTIISAQTLRTLGKGHVYSLESSEEYAEKTRQALRQQGLEDFATVIVAPISPVEIDGKTFDWYATSGLDEIPEQVDLLFVDGPPARGKADARYPAWPLLRSRLTTDAVIVLDDFIRDGEQQIAASWIQQMGANKVEKRELDTEKGTCILQLA